MMNKQECAKQDEEECARLRKELKEFMEFFK